ncbi:3-oxoacyl-ACP synthase III family protein [Mucilaginibacter sp.]
MSKQTYSIIIGSGSYIPKHVVPNQDFINNEFYGPDGLKLTKSNQVIIDQFEQITGIRERRYVTDDLLTSDIAALAALEAISSAKIDGETLDYIIVAHNFGDVTANSSHSDMVPALASRVKNQLGIVNPDTVVYDLPFGCAGWLQGLIQADGYIRSGDAKKVLIIGAETLSRICDPHDRDSMIYADGAGAVILAAIESEEPVGIIAHKSKSYANELTYVLKMAKSAQPGYMEDRLFLKMQGRKLYEHVLKLVPAIIKECIAKAGLSIDDMDKLLIHQANNKMDEAVLKQLYELYDLKSTSVDIMPMTISWLGNSSVATLPTLYDLIERNKFEGQSFTPGKMIVFASVGAGVNLNSVVYRIPFNEQMSN